MSTIPVTGLSTGAAVAPPVSASVARAAGSGGEDAARTHVQQLSTTVLESLENRVNGWVDGRVRSGLGIGEPFAV